jgi:hypothetical protein
VTTVVQAQDAIARAERMAVVLAPLWKAARRWAAAVVLAAFPFLFIVDGPVHWPVSPVLPGLVILAIVLVGLPFLLVEGMGRRYRRRDAAWQARKAARAVQWANAALLLAVVWLVAWFLVGA